MKSIILSVTALLGLSVSATVLVSDGFPVGEGGYATGKTAVNAQAITDESVVGFEWSKWNDGGGSGVIYSFGSDSGLAFPACFADKGFTAVGASVGFNSTQAGNPRAAEKKFTIANPGGLEKVYFRCLVFADQTCADNISTPTASAPLMTATTSYVTGLSTSWNTDAGKYDYIFTTKGNMLFGIARNSDGNVELDLCMIDAAGTKSVYTLVPSESFAAGKTYICVLELAIGAGTDGKEQIRAFACDIENYSPALDWAMLGGESETVEAEVWSETAYPQYITICGRYQNNSGYFKADEFVLATKLSEVVYWTTDLPVLSEAEVLSADDGFSVSAKMEQNSATLKALAYADDESDPIIVECPDQVDEGESVSFALKGLAADTTYRIELVAENEKGQDRKELGVIYTGVPEITVTGDASEGGFVKGRFKVTRADSSAALVVNYACGGSAVGGLNYVDLSGTVVIPAGETEAVVEVSPLLAFPHDQATILEISLASGYYPMATEPSVASLTIENLAPPEEFNAWIAPVDGNASDPANWSKGRVPLATDDILVDGTFSQAQLTWDGAGESLTDTVASWTQTESYTNAVVFNQSRTGDFTVFNVTGDATLAGGSWTHPNNGSASGAAANVWLNLRFGGDLETAAAFSFTADLKGYYKARGPSGTTSGQNGGASHGGQGGPSDATSNPYSDTVCYDDYREPIMLGAGGFSGTSDWGGGAIHIEVAGTFSHAGLITANGGRVGTNGPGGGSVWLVAGRLTGDGAIQANGGGSNANNNKGGGGGGRVAVYVQEDVSYATFRESFTGVISAYGGDGLNTGKSHNSGAAGTVYVETGMDQGVGRMIVSHSDELLRKASKGWTIYGTARVESGVTWNVSDLILAEHGRVGVCAGGQIKVPSFSRITGDGSTMTLLRFCDCGDGVLVSDVRHDRLTADGFGVESYGTSSMSSYHLIVPETSTLKVAGTFTVGSLKVNGTKLPKGEYVASSLTATYSNVSGDGTINVLGLEDGLALIVR